MSRASLGFAVGAVLSGLHGGAGLLMSKLGNAGPPKTFAATLARARGEQMMKAAPWLLGISAACAAVSALLFVLGELRVS